MILNTMDYKILLSQGKFTLLDKSDYDKLSKHKWYCGGRGYAIRHSPMVNGKRKKILMHRLITNAPKNKEVDHINGNRLDNRKSNLRVCTRMENLHNQKLARNNKSGYKGVYFRKEENKWDVTIGINNTKKSIGTFINKSDAIKARINAEKFYYGEFANMQII